MQKCKGQATSLRTQVVVGEVQALEVGRQRHQAQQHGLRVLRQATVGDAQVLQANAKTSEAFQAKRKKKKKN